MARLLRKVGGDQLEIFELNLGVNRFGRDPRCDFPIDHPTVSSSHCEVILSLEGVKVRDCASTNGTFVNGHSVREAVLAAGQMLRLGEVEFLVETVTTTIAIPKYERPRPAPPVVLADGSMLCPRHPEALVTHRCPHCHEVLCDACVHRLRRRRGKVFKLCGLCSFPCESLAPEEPKRKYLLSVLNKTIKLPLFRACRVSVGDYARDDVVECRPVC